MQITQEKMDRRAIQLSKMIAEANQLADMLCRQGDSEASGNWRMVAGQLTVAYGLARKIKPTSSTTPVPLFGGDGK